MDATTLGLIFSACAAAISGLFAVLMRSKDAHHREVVAQYEENETSYKNQVARLEKRLDEETECADELTDKIEELLREQGRSCRRDAPRDERRERAKSGVHELTTKIRLGKTH